MKVYYGLTNYSQLKRMPRDLPIMVSARWLIKLSVNSTAFKYIREYSSVFLDSGAFGAAFYDGGFKFTTNEYLDLVSRLEPEYWASMDFPCEPKVRNGMTVLERINMTVEKAVELSKANLKGFVPIIQGWMPDEYLKCVDLMEKQSVIYPIMGIGTLCRRGKQEPIVNIIRHLHDRLPNVKFHAFGVKISALRYKDGEVLNYLHSIDTAAWQFNEKDELGGWRPRTHAEIDRRLKGYKEKLDLRIEGPYQLTL